MIVTKTKTNTHQSNSSLFVMYQLSDGGGGGGWEKKEQLMNKYLSGHVECVEKVHKIDIDVFVFRHL